MGEYGLVGLGPPTVTTLRLSNNSVAILAQERGIAPHSHLSPLPSLPNGEMLRELGGGSSGARHWVYQRLRLHQQHCCCCSGALQAGGSRLALSPSHLPRWGGASVTLGVCYANVQGGHAGRTRSADRMRSRPLLAVEAGMGTPTSPVSGCPD